MPTSSEAPFVSVIIPTYNRAALLRDAIDSFLQQTYPADRYEIVVADNNSRDATQSLVSSYVDPRVRWLFEGRQGVHYARNSAAKAARGEILYFTDDDMVADPRLLDELVRVLAADPSIATATGKIVARFNEEPPPWVRRHLINGLLSVTEPDRPDELIVSDRDFGVYSCHQALRREVFFQVGGFNPENTAGVWIGDGETGMNLKIAAMGHRFAYVPSSVIYHRIPRERTTLAYLVGRLGNQGFCDAYTAYRRHRTRAGIVTAMFVRNTFGAVKLLAGTLYSIARGKLSWHFLPAHLAYLHRRNVYDLRLLRDPELRRLAVVDDWLGAR